MVTEGNLLTRIKGNDNWSIFHKDHNSFISYNDKLFIFIIVGFGNKIWKKIGDVLSFKLFNYTTLR